MTTLIIGCGYLGRRVAARLVDRDEEVFGTCRSASTASELASIGVNPVLADVLDADSLRALPAADRVVYCVGYDRSAGADKRAVYVDGLRNVLDRLATAPIRLVYISSTSVYGGDDGGWVDEDSPTEPRTEAGRICLDAERVVTAWGREANVEVVVLRCSGLYGPDRIVRRSMIANGEPIPGDPDKYLNLIHIDDAAQAVTAALDASRPSGLYLVSDDRPVTRLEYYSLAADCLKAAPPRFVPPAPGSPEAARDAASRRVANRKMKAELGVKLTHPDATSGVPAALE
ncbi:MAG: SDR family oxidoreductase [Paludisphaera borealis]|uniref:SDR family oxidoreductase n=1 Tax=Paludisphaera borealis TaxID=1387353 RepID=UPI0028441426|nr:SDR family oxidoreductase [Paludisphaera borealis]MDR3621811.1 SDR family oxidoreductase [Paludisphaera borealis]